MRAVGRVLVAGLVVGVCEVSGVCGLITDWFGVQRMSAQTADRQLTALELAVACAPPPSLDVPANTPRVAGAQDTLSRSLFEPRDLLVLEGGTRAGMALGQKYYIRRPLFAEADRMHPRAIATLGWLSVVAVNETTAIGSLDHFCGGVSRGDYLEPYAAPVLPEGAERDEPAGELDFSTLGRVLSGTENRIAVALGSLMLIDRGQEQGIQPGARFAVYRDVHLSGVPLTSVGEGVVLSTGKGMSLARLTRSRDAVVPGDYVVPRK